MRHKIFYRWGWVLSFAGAGVFTLAAQNRGLHPPLRPKLSHFERLRLQQQWFMMGRRSPDRLPAAAHLLQARGEAKRIPYRQSSGRLGLSSAATAESTSWSFQGPQAINTYTANEPFGDYGQVSGTVSAIAVDLVNDPSGNTAYVGTTYGGVWKTTNALGSKPVFTPLTDSSPSLDIGAIALGPDNAQGQPKIYAGTGKWLQDIYQGLGILESSDGGSTWTLASSADDGAESFAGLSVTKIIVDPQNPQIVLAALALTVDTLPGESLNNNQFGIYRSTDGGQTWSQSLRANCTDLAYDSSDHTYYAAFTGNGIYASSDQGNSWTQLADVFANATPYSADNFTTASLAANQGKIYALIANDQNGLMGNLSMPTPCPNPASPHPGNCDTGLVVSSNGGQSWTSLPVPGNDSDGYTDSNALFCEPGTNGAQCQGGYDQFIGITPDGNTLVLGGIDVWALDLSTQSYTQITQGYANFSGQVHTDQHAIAMTNNRTWLIGNDGGLWSTTDAGGSGQSSDWNNMNATLGVTTFYSVTQGEDASGNPVFIGGAQDDGTSNSQTGKSQWQALFGGDGGWTMTDPNHPQYYLFEADGGGPGGIGLGVTTYGNTVNNFGSIANSNTITDWNDGGNIPLVFPYQFVSSHSAQLVVASNCRIWTGPDQVNNQTSAGNPAPGWMAISGDLTADNSEFDCKQAQGFILAMAVAPSSPDTVYAAATSGKLWVTVNATCSQGSSPSCQFPTWAEIDAGLPVDGNHIISSIAVNPTNSQTLLVTLMGFGSGHVFLSTDGGASWTDISGTIGSGGLPDAPANGVLIDPSNPKNIYVATDVGVFAATDGGAAGGNEQWEQLAPGLPDVPITQLQLSQDEKTLIAATFGRGAWTIPMLSTASGPAPDVALSPSSLTFGSVNLGSSSAASTITLTNSGNAALSINGITIGGADNGDFSQTNTCGSSVAAGTNCTISVIFTPTATGSRSATLSIADNASGSPQTVALTGTGATVSSGGGFTGNIVQIGGGGQNDITNQPQSLLSVLFQSPDSIALGYPGTGYLVDGSDIDKIDWSTTTIESIAQTSVGEIAVDSNGNVYGSDGTTVGMMTPDGSITTIAGGGSSIPNTVPMPAQDASFFAIGGVAVDGAGNIYVSDPMRKAVDELYLSNGNYEVKQILSEQQLTAPGANGYLAADGQGNLFITYDCGSGWTDSVYKLNLSTLQLVNWAGCADTIPSTSPQAATQLSISPVAIAADEDGNLYIASSPSSLAVPRLVVRVDSSGNGIRLAGGGSQTPSTTPQLATSVSLNPVGLSLDASGNLYITDAEHYLLLEMPVSSSSGTAPAVTLSPSSLSFGSVNVSSSSAASTITLTNSGNVALSITSISIGGANAGDFSQTNTCGNSVAAGANCAISVIFTPTATGSRSATLSIADNAAGSPQTVALTGTGTVTAPGVTLSPSSLSFGSVNVGSSSTASSVTLANSGNAALSITSISIGGANAGDFSQTNTCGNSVAAGANCAISVVFTPSAAGARSATLSIADNASGSPQTVALSGTGATSSGGNGGLSGQIVAVAGGGSTPPSTTPEALQQAEFSGPTFLVTSGTGGYILDNGGSEIERVDGSAGTITLFAGCEVNCVEPTTALQPATSVSLVNASTGYGAQALAFDANGNIYIADLGNGFVDKITTGGQLSVIAGCGEISGCGTAPTTSPMPALQAEFQTVTGVAVDSAGNIYVSDEFQQAVYEITVSNMQIKLIAGGGSGVVSTSPQAATSIALNGPDGLAVDGFGHLYINDYLTEVDRLNLSTGGIVVYAGNGSSSDTGPQPSTTPQRATTVALVPYGLAVSPTGMLYISSPAAAMGYSGADVLTQVDTSGYLTLIAGGGSAMPSYTPQPATSIQFTPIGVDMDSTGNLFIADYQNNFILQMPSSNSGSSAAVTLSPSSLVFGSVNVGSSSAASTVKLTNSGNAALSITSISIGGANAGDFSQTNTCGNSVAAGANCTISVIFTPSAAGACSATLSIADNASSSPQTVALSGTGASTAPAVTLSPNSLAFGSVNVSSSSAASTITLTNSGNAALSITGISIGGANAGDFSQTNTCGNSVAAGANCAISLIFTPSAAGARSATLSIADNASNSPQTVALSGTGVATAEAKLSANSLSFSSELTGASSDPQSVTVSNTGTATLTPTITLAGSNPGDFNQTNTCGNSVAAGATCTISVIFTPSTTGARSATISIADNAAGSPQSVALTGTGDDITIGPASGSSTTTSVNPGQTASYVLSFTGTVDYSATLALTCSGAPSEASCTVSPTSLSLSNGVSGNATVSVSTTAASALPPMLPSAPWNRPGPWLYWLFAGTLAALLLLSQRKALRLAGLACLLTAGIACGGGGGSSTPPPPPSNSGTPAGTYTLTITATANTGGTRSENLTLTVN